MTYKEAFGKLLTKLREEQNLSKTKLAKLTGLSRTFIIRLENGERSPTIDTVYKIANALGIKGSQILEKMENDR